LREKGKEKKSARRKKSELSNAEEVDVYRGEGERIGRRKSLLLFS